jgi:endoglucanase
MRQSTFASALAIAASLALVGCIGEDASGVLDEALSTNTAGLSSTAACAKNLPADTRFYVRPPDQGAVSQIGSLIKAKDFGNALRIAGLESTPMAVWFNDGSPADVQTSVHATMAAARREHRVPILVSYNLPFRDCAQYSGGGATDTAVYEAWIDGFAGGIGDGKAVVVLEPDGLGIIPYNTTIAGAEDWCRPTVTDDLGNVVPAPGASPVERYAQLNYAVDILKSKAPNAAVYLDGTHSGWLPVGEAAYRLAKAGAARAAGFFLNVSNYQPTAPLVQYGNWISQCIYYASNAAEGGWRLGHYAYCASQYYPATPTDYGTWSLTDQWYTDNVTNAANPPLGPSALPHFVIDTGRNGQGPLNTARYAAAPFNQPPTVVSGLNAGSWCNARGAGLGLRPTADTGEPLTDAYLWLKTPGESDGSCDIAGGARAWDFSQYNPWSLAGDAQNQFDPLWGMVDPAAGAWFAEQALELAQLAEGR